MSTGRRLAKRSILGSRVCVPGGDGRYHPGAIVALRSRGGGGGGIPDTRGATTTYCVLLDTSRQAKDFQESDLVGAGFRSTSSVKLVPGQRVYVTYRGREVAGEVVVSDVPDDGTPDAPQLLLRIWPQGASSPVEVRKRREEVRLLESRKSARLMEQEMDFARLADEGRRRAASRSIDVPSGGGSRKRRPSAADDPRSDLMDECAAAMVLMSLSCSPHSPRPPEGSSPAGSFGSSSGSSSSSSGASSWLSAHWPDARSATPSPPLPNQHLLVDEGVVLDDDDSNLLPHLPRKKKATRTVFQCTWPGCNRRTSSCADIERHVRLSHLGRGEEAASEESSEDREEEFYYTELELEAEMETEYNSPNMEVTEVSSSSATSTNTAMGECPNCQSCACACAQGLSSGGGSPSPPTLSHMDMARPPHEDPEYQRQLLSTPTVPIHGSTHSPLQIVLPPGGMSPTSAAATTFSWPLSPASPASPHKLFRLGPRAQPSGMGAANLQCSPTSVSGTGPCSVATVVNTASGPKSPVRKARGESKKCRKVYGMEHRDLWCTQCKWKKACSRFGD